MAELTTTCVKCGKRAFVIGVHSTIEPAEGAASVYGVAAYKVSMGREHCPHCGHTTTVDRVIEREPISGK